MNQFPDQNLDQRLYQQFDPNFKSFLQPKKYNNFNEMSQQSNLDVNQNQNMNQGYMKKFQNQSINQQNSYPSGYYNNSNQGKLVFDN